MAYIFLVMAFVINAIANILLKIAATSGVSLTLENGVFSAIVRNGYLLLGLTAFAVNVIFYFIALRSLPLSVAYPVMIAGGFMLVGTYAVLFLHEPLAPLQLAGYSMIVLGVFLVLARGAAA